MFMAGLETKFSSFNGFKKQLVFLSFINSVIPLVVGVLIALAFGYSMTIALLVGVIFVSSSIAVVIPSLEKFGILHTRLGQSVVMTTVLQDIASLIMLSMILQNLDPITKLPLYIFYPLLFFILITFKILLPKAKWLFTVGVNGTKDLFQQEFRSMFLLLIGTVVVFELLGLHPIIGGFFAGLVLADSVTNPTIKDKIHAISYGVFIPTFFVLIGAQTDISVFYQVVGILPLIIAIILGSVLSKLISGWIGGRMVGFDSKQSLLFGISSVPQLSTTLAVAFTAFTLGLIDEKLLTAMVTLSVVTTIVSPTLMNIFSGKMQKAAKVV